MKKKLLVTGGAGYIGTHTLLEVFNENEWDVLSADSFINSYPESLERVKAISGKTVKNYEIDLCNLEKVRAMFKENADIFGIIHFAALKSVPESVENPELYYRNNNESLKNLLACSKEFKIPYFIFSSSCSVYGNISTLPVNEETPLNKAESPYAETKKMGEEICKQFAKENPQVKVVALRYFNPAGAHESGRIGEEPKKPMLNLVPAITGFAKGKRDSLMVFGDDYDTRDGTCIRDYIHVTDIAIAHIKALKFLMKENSGDNYFLFNLGTGNGVSVKEAIASFEKIASRKLNYTIVPRRAGDVMAIYSDSTKALKFLNWKAERTIDDMMRSAWKWEQR